MAESGQGAQHAEANEVAHESQGSRAPRRWGPMRSSSGYVTSLRRVAVANAAPSVSVERLRLAIA